MPKKKTKENKLDPNQLAFINGYFNPKSKTFGNALQSALNAGYSQEYAESILSKDLKWLSESVGNLSDEKLVAKALKNMDNYLEKGKDNYKYDASKFMLKNLNKDRFNEKLDISGDIEHKITIVSEIGSKYDKKD